MDPYCSSTTWKAPERGIKRQMTPEHKPRASTVADRRVKPRLEAKAASKRDASSEEMIIMCQVCCLCEDKWPQSEPLLLNALGKPVKVPGRFCSKVHCSPEQPSRNTHQLNELTPTVRSGML